MRYRVRCFDVGIRVLVVGTSWGLLKKQCENDVIWYPQILEQGNDADALSNGPQAPADATVEIQVVAALAAVAVAAKPAVPAAAAAAALAEPDNEDTVMEDAEAQLAQLASAEVREMA